MNKDVRKSVFRFAWLAAALLLLLLTAACASKPPAATEAPPAPAATEAPGGLKRGGELRLARLEEPLTMDFLQNLHPPKPGHRDIDDRQIGPVFGDDLERCSTVDAIDPG